MGIKIGTNIDFRSMKPNFVRDHFKTMKEMVETPSYHLTEGQRAYCFETDAIFIFRSSNKNLPEVGQWRQNYGSEIASLSDGVTSKYYAWSSYHINSLLQPKATNAEVEKLKERLDKVDEGKEPRTGIVGIEEKLVYLDRTKASNDYLNRKTEEHKSELGEFGKNKITKTEMAKKYVTQFTRSILIPKTDAPKIYRFKGSVETKEELEKITNMKKGEVYNVKNERGMNFAWDGTKWDSLGGTVVLPTLSLKSEMNEGVNALNSRVATELRVDLDRILALLDPNATKTYVRWAVGKIDRRWLSTPYEIKDKRAKRAESIRDSVITYFYRGNILNEIYERKAANWMRDDLPKEWEKRHNKWRYPLLPYYTFSSAETEARINRRNSWLHSNYRNEQQTKEAQTSLYNGVVSYATSELNKLYNRVSAKYNTLKKINELIEKETKDEEIDRLKEVAANKLDKVATAADSGKIENLTIDKVLTKEQWEETKAGYYTREQVDKKIKEFEDKGTFKETSRKVVPGLPTSKYNHMHTKWCWIDEDNILIAGGESLPSDGDYSRRTRKKVIEKLHIPSGTYTTINRHDYCWSGEIVSAMCNYKGRLILGFHTGRIFELFLDQDKLVELPFKIREKEKHNSAFWGWQLQHFHVYEGVMFGSIAGSLAKFNLEDYTFEIVGRRRISWSGSNDIRVSSAVYKGKMYFTDMNLRNLAHNGRTKEHESGFVNRDRINYVSLEEPYNSSHFYSNTRWSTAGSSLLTATVNGEEKMFLSGGSGFEIKHWNNDEFPLYFYNYYAGRVHSFDEKTKAFTRYEGIFHRVSGHFNFIYKRRFYYSSGFFTNQWNQERPVVRSVYALLDGNRVDANREVVNCESMVLHTGQAGVIKEALFSDPEYNTYLLNNITLIHPENYTIEPEDPKIRFLEPKLNKIKANTSILVKNVFEKQYVQPIVEHYDNEKGWLRSPPTYKVNPGDYLPEEENLFFGLSAEYRQKDDSILISAGKHGIFDTGTNKNTGNQEAKLRLWLIKPNRIKPTEVTDFRGYSISKKIHHSGEIRDCGDWVLSHNRPTKVLITENVEEVFIYDPSNICASWPVFIYCEQGSFKDNQPLIIDVGLSMIHLFKIDNVWNIDVR